jgi:asparagine synthase (glutamine-hydrolysing)
MCGIAGILHFDASTPLRAEIESLTARVNHRGPDGKGFHVEGPVALGHRRLSIIDLATGAQPMSVAHGAVWITYNGELYNYRELREELRAAGHSFRTTSDTEVILLAWVEWGEACVERFRGMFAFAISDFRRRVVFMARDQLGIKPLHYFQSGRRMAFASELQALRALPDCPREIDPHAIDQYLFLLYVPPPNTVYRGVSKLAPGHRVTFGFDGKTSGPQRYWQFRIEPQGGLSIEEWTQRLESVLRDSVRAHLVSDVPFGAFLSGGIDSTAVVALMSEELGRPVKTFSIGFEQEQYNELAFARQVANKFRTDHHEEVVGPGHVSILPEIARHFGEPFGDSSAIPTYFVSRLARQHVPMVLSGDGGDEAFIGYGRYFQWHEWINPGLRNRRGWRRVVRPGLAALWPRRFPSRRHVEPKDWLAWVAGADAQSRLRLLRPEFAGVVDRSQDALEGILHDAQAVAPEQYGQFIDFNSYLPNDILTKVDIATMAHGLESRTPLTDVRVAEFAASIPWEMNLRRNEQGTWTGKHLLKRIVGRHFGPEFLERRKAGFSIPLNHWFAPGGALREELEDRLRPGSAQVYRYLRPESVHALIDAHQPLGDDKSSLLWQVLFLENWLQHAEEPVQVSPQPSVA